MDQQICWRDFRVNRVKDTQKLNLKENHKLITYQNLHWKYHNGKEHKATELKTEPVTT